MDQVQTLEERVRLQKMLIEHKSNMKAQYKRSQEIDFDRQTLNLLEAELKKAKDQRLLNG